MSLSRLNRGIEVGIQPEVGRLRQPALTHQRIVIAEERRHHTREATSVPSAFDTLKR
jgi:hypothetical protein